ncbi:MAG: CoA pyrophosphatase [Leptospiraceae bacterium]|nr:CoA pyrophosphatase [Leptospiraceae bacterium]MCB1304991.1 CoA pyrophosphatase [Leptospiraceae bacterium]
MNSSPPPIPIDPDWIAYTLQLPLPGHRAHEKMSRRSPDTMIIPPGAAEAAVLITMFPGDAGLFPLIQRPHREGGAHAGQISLPGGKREPGEELSTTALRETEEEIGLDSSRIQLLGALSPLYIPVSGFAVYPYVGWYEGPLDFRPDPAEVDEVLLYDLNRLRDPGYRTIFDFQYRGKDFQSPGFKLDDRIIWGATAMILMEFAEHLQSTGNHRNNSVHP